MTLGGGGRGNSPPAREFAKSQDLSTRSAQNVVSTLFFFDFFMYIWVGGKVERWPILGSDRESTVNDV